MYLSKILFRHSDWIETESQVVLHCIYLMVKYVKCVLKALLTIDIPSFENFLFSVIAPYKTKLGAGFLDAQLFEIFIHSSARCLVGNPPPIFQAAFSQFPLLYGSFMVVCYPMCQFLILFPVLLEFYLESLYLCQ